MLVTLLTITYFIGLVTTTFLKADEEADLQMASFMTTERFMSLGMSLFLTLKGTLAGILWPLYWAVRLLHAPAERLLLPPGDTL